MAKKPMTVATLIAILKTNPKNLSKPIYIASDEEMNQINPIFEVAEITDMENKPLVIIPHEGMCP